MPQKPRLLLVVTLAEAGGAQTYAAQLIAGLRYAFPRAMARLERGFPRIPGLHDQIAARPNINAYLKSKRRIPFNEHGVFRHYPELDTDN